MSRASRDKFCDVGAKTALLAFSHGDIREALREANRAPRPDVEALVHRLHPGYVVASAGDGALYEDTYPAEDITYATLLDGVELYCDRRFMFDRPSELPNHLREAGEGRRTVLHGMHSGSDWLGFAVWEDGTLIRSLSLSPADGIMESIGEPYHFELPFWAGEHPVTGLLQRENDEPYPFPFHPLELGDAALRALFGFAVEGRVVPGDVDAEAVPLYGFRVTSPSGEVEAARDAEMAEVLRRMGPPRRLTFAPDGTLQEINPTAGPPRRFTFGPDGSVQEIDPSE